MNKELHFIGDILHKLSLIFNTIDRENPMDSMCADIFGENLKVFAFFSDNCVKTKREKWFSD